jgi:heme A synthase
MRPKSIILFERLFLISIILTAISAYLSFGQTLAQIETNADFKALGWDSSAVIITAILYVAFLLLLYYLIAYRASVIAKWILVLVTVLSMTTLPSAIAVQSGVPLILAVMTNLSALAAIILLFFSDARAWLGSKPEFQPRDADAE